MILAPPEMSEIEMGGGKNIPQKIASSHHNLRYKAKMQSNNKVFKLFGNTLIKYCYSLITLTNFHHCAAAGQRNHRCMT